MKYTKFILAAVIALLTCIATTGCMIGGGVTPEIAAQKVERARDARETLWLALQDEKALFSQDEWEVLDGAHQQAAYLSIVIEEELSTGAWPTAENVEEWKVVGKAARGAAARILEPRLASLSTRTQTAWAIEDLRLTNLSKVAQDYLDNPNAATYSALAEVGLSLLGATL